MSLYVYCLGDELTEEAFAGLTGVCGASVRLLRLGRLAAVVSETGEQAVAVTDENVLAHNRVNSAALASSTPLPFRFGTRAARERLAEYASANEAALLEGLARVRGCVEMSVKLMWKRGGLEKPEGGGRGAGVESEGAGREPGGAALEPTASLPESSKGFMGAGGGGGRGTAFLLAKRREIMGEEEEGRRAEELAAWLASAVSEVVRETEARVNPSEAIVVRAAHLVERARVGEYRERVRALAAEPGRPRLLASGPWPPYSFSNIRQ